MIDRDHALPITRQAQLLGISRGAVVCLPRPTSPAELDLMRRIDELHLAVPVHARACCAGNCSARTCTSAGATSPR